MSSSSTHRGYLLIVAVVCASSDDDFHSSDSLCHAVQWASVNHTSPWGASLGTFALVLFSSLQKMRVGPNEERNLQAGWPISLSGLTACPYPCYVHPGLEEGKGNFVMPSLKHRLVNLCKHSWIQRCERSYLQKCPLPAAIVCPDLPLLVRSLQILFFYYFIFYLTVMVNTDDENTCDRGANCQEGWHEKEHADIPLCSICASRWAKPTCKTQSLPMVEWRCSIAVQPCQLTTGEDQAH